MSTKEITVGDSVKIKGGKTGKVLQVTGNAALVETGKGEDYAATWYSKEVLGGSRQAAPAEEGDE